MRSILATNPDIGLMKAAQSLMTDGVIESSRVGDVWVAPHPVVTVWEQPKNRVSLSPARDANPFFHLYEALWMLAGSRNATLLDYFVHDFSSRYAEKDGNQHGAYGYRWRRHFNFDQLEFCIKRLISEPDSRQIVLEMWDPDHDFFGSWKDRPCNTHIYFRRRGEVLDMTVCCRSNDIYWGCYGANAVHFSVLLEYVAARVGCDIGTYYQFSNNFHLYMSMTEKVDKIVKEWYSRPPLPISTLFLPGSSYESDIMRMVSLDLGSQTETFEFAQVIKPMFMAYEERKSDPERALSYLNETAHDWHFAAAEWIKRRMK